MNSLDSNNDQNISIEPVLSMIITTETSVLQESLTTLSSIVEAQVSTIVIEKLNEPLSSIVELSQIHENKLLNILDILFDYANSTLCPKSISPNNIITVVTGLLHIVENYKKLTGYQKKLLVLDTVKKIINERIDNDQDKNILIIISNTTLPCYIDTMISAINGKLKFKKSKLLNITLPLWCKKIRTN